MEVRIVCMVRLVRPLALVGLLLLMGGLLIDAVGQGVVCFDVCPPDETAARLRVGLETLTPGLAAGVVVWAMVPVALARRGRHVGAVSAALIPPALAIGYLVVGPYFTHSPPAPGAPASRALHLLVWSYLVLCGLMLVASVLPIEYGTSDTEGRHGP